jgi:triacylglycerol lipase
MIASKEIVMLAAKACQLAYGGKVSEFQALGFGQIYPLFDEATDTQAYVLVNDNTVIVVFPGTQSRKDWQTDIDFKRTEHPFLIDEKFSVHRGFLKAWNAIGKQLDRLDAEKGILFPARTVIVTGHSLGGSLAMLCGLTCGSAKVSHVITFGQPRVGDRAFARIYRDCLGLQTTRVVNGLDAVTLMPPWLLGYRHAVGYVIFIDSAGEVLVNPAPATRLISHAFCVLKDWMHLRWVNIGGWSIPLPFRLSAVRNHFMADYLKALEAWK